MSGISGKVREQKEFGLKIGLAEVEVVAINPNTEEYKDILGIELKEDSKATEYLGESKEGNTSLRIDVWVKEVKGGANNKITFFLENKQKENKEGTKKQYINTVGVCSWADKEQNLPTWFTKRDYRIAFVGEEELYSFLKTWLGKLDLRADDATLQLDWKKFMKGNVKDIQDQINGEFATTFAALYTVKSVEKDEGVKNYQSIYNRAFLPAYTIKNFRLVDYTKEAELSKLRVKKSADLKPHERFVIQVTGEYGVKDSYILKDIKDYNPDEFLVASDKPMSDDGADY